MEVVRAGCTVEVAAACGGVSRRTVYAWLQRAEVAGKRGQPYREFRTELERARADAEHSLVVKLQRAADQGSVSAAQFLLERRFPERWLKPKDRPAARRALDEAAELEREQAKVTAPSPDEDSADELVAVSVDEVFAGVDELAAKRATR